jgi:hypothetical protein
MNWHQVTEWGRSEVVRLSRSGTPEELMLMARMFKVCRLMVGAVEYGGIDGAHLGTRGLLHDTATN